MDRITRVKKLPGLLGWFAASFAAAAAGGLASAGSGGFYQMLIRPGWAPPPWLFGPVWTVLYAMMGVAALLVWLEKGFRGARTALSLYLAQLVFNALWTWLFFEWRLGAAAFIEILVLWVLIAITMVAFWRVKPVAGVMLVPYLAWVSFASALTCSVWRSNPALLG